MIVDDAAPGPGPARWKVLLVDDEPAVHEISRLILSGLSFEGRDVDLLSASSAAEARDLLAHQKDIALALLDVVMETDDAGIALVRHVREQLRDHDMQIVLRTGQPGMAPEREVIQRYEINGYFLKTEITAQRLHSIVIAGLRGYRHARSLRAPEPHPAAQPAPTPRQAAHPLADDVLEATLRGRVLLQAQPEVALASNEVAGIELVPQWRTAQGLVPAGRACEVLPEGEARRRVAHWLVVQGCHWARTWSAAAGRPLRVSIPLVGESLAAPDVAEMVAAAVHEAGLAPGMLDLLVAEATLFGGHPGVAVAVELLHAAGVTLTLADFGARTIPLQRLNQQLPDRLKIHRIYVRGVAGDPERMALARSLIALAQTLNIVAVADGIATDADAQFFKWEGCELGQGDALAPACAAAEVADVLQHGHRARH
jgi:EAL domain-containing protein (putative c-di-GMP-specific phosphodiesterase class I)